MQKLASRRYGKCLSSKYINAHTKLKWQCAKGHEWEATPNHVKRGQWCLACSGSLPLTIEQMQKLAKKHGGKCLSKKYINRQTKLKWRCSMGHIWETVPSVVKNGYWCPHCSGMAKLTIEQMQKLAANRGGFCLSKKYINAHTKLKWRCAEGHEWEAMPSGIKTGTWCPTCGFQRIIENICREIFQIIFKKKFYKNKPAWLRNNNGQRMELDGYNKELSLAFEYHGVQHFSYSKFFHTKTSFTKRKKDDITKRFLCEQHGVKLIEIPFTIQIPDLYKFIITQCRKLDLKIPPHKKVDATKLKLSYFAQNILKLNHLAEKRGGSLLSQTYFGSNTKLKWRCAEGHEWEAVPSSVKSGKWCKYCSGLMPLTIEQMRKLATNRGGFCLSKKYINSHTKLKWRCAEGHEWEAAPTGINTGTWCPMCAGNLSLTIEQMQGLATKHGGLCLSNKYTNAQTKLRWQCSEGHQWEAKPNGIQSGTWCPKCSYHKRAKKAWITKRLKKQNNQAKSEK